jgi:hypothetical protein
MFFNTHHCAAWNVFLSSEINANVIKGHNFFQMMKLVICTLLSAVISGKYRCKDRITFIIALNILFKEYIHV